MARILVIDDDAEMLELIRVVLERRGEHQVIRSADGAEGVALAVADPPDLAIVDIMMPGITGHEVCRQLRAHPATAKMPIIVLTARGQPIDRQAALEAGATEFVAKPVPLSELLEKVNAVLAEAHPARAEPRSVVLLGLRGGVGTTTVAVNLAAALAQSNQGTVCLVDLCPASGHVALQLGLRPMPNWSGLLEVDQMDWETVTPLLLEHPSGLRVLASPVVPLVQQDLARTTVQALLGVLLEQFDVVVVDAPPVLNEAATAALESAWRIGLVTTADPPALQTAVGTLRALRDLASRCHLILNHPTPEPQWPADAIQRVLKRAPSADIPFDPGQAQALKSGQPLTLHTSESPLTQAIQNTLQALTGAEQGGKS